MNDLFREFWWLLFPMGFMALGGFRAWLDYRARQNVMRAVRELTDAGREPPAALLAQLQR